MDVVEVFVQVDSVGCVSGGGGECKHEVRDYTCPGVQNPKLCNEEGMVGEDGDSDGVGDESSNGVVGGQDDAAMFGRM